MFGSHGRYRTETLAKGDVGYIPQGYGHSIENVGSKACRVLIGFNTGHLRDDRPVAVDRRQPGRRAGDQLRQAGRAVREVPATETCSSQSRMGVENPGLNPSDLGNRPGITSGISCGSTAS